MLEELKNHDYCGGKEGLLFFICDVIGKNRINRRDAEVICSHAPGRLHLSGADLICYSNAFGWVQIEDDVISLSSSLTAFTDDKAMMNEKLILSTVEQLFSGEILNASLFSYDVVQHCYSFKNELFPLPLSCIRNALISQGFLIPLRDPQGTRFYISPLYDALIGNHCKAKRKQLSLETLKKQLEENEASGEKAELFVVEYEKKRIGPPLCEKIKRISEIDVAAGYDIVSYNSDESQEPDRFIEVKAVSSSGFFWSRNEYEIAKLKGDKYFFYLVELSKTNEPGYTPEIIQNPAVNVMEADTWFVEAQSYHIKHV